ncbi:hypothetical protein SAMN05192555_10528 [Franzmannia pantelleriensis]|uniref:Pre-peptidase C-terminal domain-containing protein n=1 Tax=Franzmannia pantelleriensis TaxID=48727 RepID=A0A1G9KQC8_9GAMM|nr:hypothetical protein [Halomonas pantelleriensis]SDL51683.1 hypothetical protein SAMN05192555_10528 [Halomonas pantelleriensis]
MPYYLRALTVMTLLVLLAGCAASAPHEQRAISLQDGDEIEIVSAGARYITFTLENPATVVLESHTHPGQQTQVIPNARLLDAEGQQVARDWDGGRGHNFRLEQQLEPGVWFLHVMNPFACNGERRCSDLDYRYRISLDVIPD